MTSRARNALIAFPIAVLVVAIDQFVKTWLLTSFQLASRSPAPLWGPLQLNLSFNNGVSFGFLRGDDKSWFPAYSPEQLTAAVDSNLKNLGVDALDIVNLRCGAAHGPNEESVAERLGTLIELKRQGKVKHIGLSTISLGQYKEARALTEIVCVQNLYNLATRGRRDAHGAREGRRRVRAVLPARRLHPAPVLVARRCREGGRGDADAGCARVAPPASG